MLGLNYQVLLPLDVSRRREQITLLQSVHRYWCIKHVKNTCITASRLTFTTTLQINRLVVQYTNAVVYLRCTLETGLITSSI